MREGGSHSSTVILKKERSKGRRGKAGSKRSKKTTPTPRPPSVATIVEEIVVAGGVAKYYVTRAEDKGSVFLTQNEGIIPSNIIPTLL